MINARIVNNYPNCPYCSSIKMRVVNVIGLALVDGKKHIELSARCLDCSKESYYFIDTKLEERFSVNRQSDSYIKCSDKIEKVEEYKDEEEDK